MVNDPVANESGTAPLPPFLAYPDVATLPGPVVLVDARWYADGRDPRAAYERGHVPGAVFVDLDRVASGPPTPRGGGHPLPEPARFAEDMAALGLRDADTVIAYDDAGGVIAARLVWMLRVTGHRAAVLDGGIAAYPGELAAGSEGGSGSGSGGGPGGERGFGSGGGFGSGDGAAGAARRGGGFSARPWPQSVLVEIDALADPGVLPVDARNRDRFEGAPDPLDPRPGRIRGAVNVPCRANLDPGGRLLPAERIRANFAAAGVHDAERLVSYCGSGVTACHNLLTAELVGLGRGRLYVGGWSAYGRDTTWPAEIGAAPAGH
jgi:thiosulfate/3-mercaptopyruvate sulfurtransferase